MTPFHRWTPEVGPEFVALLHDRPEPQRDRIRADCLSILGNCIQPDTPASIDSQRAGLVLGLVQSGKTSSFTAVAALARDNRYNLVIVIAGTTTILQDQTHDRLKHDLGLDEMASMTRWALLKNPSKENSAGQALRAKIEQHRDATSEDDLFDLAIPLVVVMKQHLHLNNLNELLRDIGDLTSTCALVIDDEAHMHSPNVAAEGDQSATYARMRTLRSRLRVHTFLQYTATPQANLLAHIADELSPDFVYLLEPGQGYTGGEYFFVQKHDSFLETIPDSELYALSPEEFEIHGAPPSLRAAFISFLVSCAIGRHAKEQEPLHSAMLVHPHSTTVVQGHWYQSVRSMRDAILLTLQARDNDPDRSAFLSSEVRTAWEDLALSNKDLPPISELVQPLVHVLKNLQVQLINSRSRQRSEVPWKNSRYWVIVGGNLMGVGFTIEGLRTTHMMRPVGVGLADTIQQRGRFFGYKDTYGSMCRAWLQADVDDAFVDYITHERELRKSLTEFADSDRPLQEWKRVFFLDARFKPTRRAAWKITMDGFKPEQTGWVQQSWLSREEAELELFSFNKDVISNFVESKRWKADPEMSGKTKSSTHTVSECTLAELRETLAELSFPGGDAQKFSALQLLLAMLSDEHPEHDTQCQVVRIASGDVRKRSPTWDAAKIDGRIVLHQGRSPSEDPNYRGDVEARDPDRITLQVHSITITEELSGANVENAIAIPFVAVYLPPQFRHDMLVQR